MSPTLLLLWEVCRALEGGFSVTTGVQNFFKRAPQDAFYYQFKTWWLMQQTEEQKIIVAGKLNFNVGQRHLLNLIQEGLKGESIYDNLKWLEKELISSCENEIHQHLSLLPIKIIFPLLCLIMPSILILLIFPLLQMLHF